MNELEKENFLPILLDDIRVGVILPFSCYVFLKHNQKPLQYFKKGQIPLISKIEKLKEYQRLDIFILKEDGQLLEDYRQTPAIQSVEDGSDRAVPVVTIAGQADEETENEILVEAGDALDTETKTISSVTIHDTTQITTVHGFVDQNKQSDVIHVNGNPALAQEQNKMVGAGHYNQVVEGTLGGKKQKIEISSDRISLLHELYRESKGLQEKIYINQFNPEEYHHVYMKICGVYRTYLSAEKEKENRQGLDTVQFQERIETIEAQTQEKIALMQEESQKVIATVRAESDAQIQAAFEKIRETMKRANEKMRVVVEHIKEHANEKLRAIVDKLSKALEQKDALLVKTVEEANKKVEDANHKAFDKANDQCVIIATSTTENEGFEITALKERLQDLQEKIDHKEQINIELHQQLLNIEHAEGGNDEELQQKRITNLQLELDAFKLEYEKQQEQCEYYRKKIDMLRSPDGGLAKVKQMLEEQEAHHIRSENLLKVDLEGLKRDLELKNKEIESLNWQVKRAERNAVENHQEKIEAPAEISETLVENENGDPTSMDMSLDPELRSDFANKTRMQLELNRYKARLDESSKLRKLMSERFLKLEHERNDYKREIDTMRRRMVVQTNLYDNVRVELERIMRRNKILTDENATLMSNFNDKKKSGKESGLMQKIKESKSKKLAKLQKGQEELAKRHVSTLNELKELKEKYSKLQTDYKKVS